MIENIWKQFHQQLLGFIASKVNDQAMAEDILQDVFIKVLNNIDSLSAADKLQPWLYQICRHAIVDYYRSKRPNSSSDELEQLHAPEVDWAAAYSEQQLNRCINTLIQDLPAHVSNILIDSELQQLKQQQIADKYKLSLPAVKSRIKRGREQLKTKLQACCNFTFAVKGMDTECKNQCGCSADS